MRTLICVAWVALRALSFSPNNGMTDGAPSLEQGRISPQSGGNPLQQGQPTGDFTIKTNAVLVTVDAIVRNHKGGFIGDLQAGDFAIYDDGVAQQISLFSPEQLPLAVALVVDRSPSIQPYLAQLHSAALTALQHLKPEDQVALFTFDMTPAQVSDLMQDRLRIAQMIGQIPGGVGTNIYDVLFDAAQYLHARALDKRRAIILVSDNCQSVPSIHSYRDTLQEVLEGAVTVYSIITRGDNPGSSYLEDPRSISRIAEESGGEVLNADSVGKLGAALDSAILNLKQGYILGFAPTNPGEDGSYHRLAVKLNTRDRCPGCQVQARSGYYAGVAAPLPLSTPPRAAGNPVASETKQLTDLEEYVAQSRILAARNDRSDLRDILFQINTTGVTDAEGTPQVRMDLQIDPSNIFFKIAGDRRVGRLRITAFYQDAKGKPLGADWRIMDMRLLEATYQQILLSGISYSTTIPLKAPKQVIKIVVYDPWSDRIGSRLVRQD